MPAGSAGLKSLRRIAAGLALGILAGSVAEAAPLDPPDAWDVTLWNGSTCTSCHLSPPGSATFGVRGFTFLPTLLAADPSKLTDAIAGRVTGPTPAITAPHPMVTFYNGGAPNPAALSAINTYLVGIRDGDVRAATPLATLSALVGQESGSTQAFVITNYRATEEDFTVSPALPAAAGGGIVFWYSVQAGGNCTSGKVAANGGSCTMEVHFKPNAAGDTSRAFTVAVGSGTPFNLSVTGTGILPAISLTPASVGTITASTSAPTDTALVLQNTGSIPVKLNALDFDSPAGPLSTLPGGSRCSVGLDLAVGATCDLIIRYAPSVTNGAGTARSLLIRFTDASGAVFGTDKTLNFTTIATSNPIPTLVSSLFPATMDRPVGSQASHSLIVQNIGSAAIASLSVTKTGSAAADYSFTENCSTSIPQPSGASTCTIELSFKPSALGVRPGSLQIDYVSAAALAQQLLITMNFQGVPPSTAKASLPASLDFGNQSINSLYPPRTLTLTNTAAGPLNINAVAISGAGFSLVDSPACPSSIAGGGKCDIRVAFQPVAAGTDYSATLQVTTNAEGSPHTATLKGRGTNEAAPVMLWSAASLDFGTVAAGSSVELDATLTNPGPGAVVFQFANAVGTHASAFKVTPVSCSSGDFIPPTGSCQFKVTFSPASGGEKLASLQAASTGSAPGLLNLRGVGLSGSAPGASLSVASLNFDRVKSGSSSDPLLVTLRSNGSTTLRVHALAVSGAFVVQGRTCPAAPFELVPGFDCTLSVTFSPRAEGAASGVLTITSDAADTPSLQVALSGQGDPAPKTSGGGGCALVRGDTPADPTLWALALAALAVLGWRRRPAAARRDAV